MAVRTSSVGNGELPRSIGHTALIKSRRYPLSSVTCCALFLPGYTLGMKTAISVPDETFARVDRRAAELGVSRSQFYATAAARYLDDLERSSLTAKINEALELAGHDADQSLVTSYSRERLAADDDW